MEIKIDGEGVTLASVPLRALAELLQAAASAVDATAKSMGVEAPVLHLIGVKGGSAAYRLVSPEEQSGPVIVDLYEAMKDRGRGSTPEVRHAMRRLHGEASKLGSLKVKVAPIRLGRARKAITVAAPVAEVATGLEEYADVHGRLVGLHVAKDGSVSISLRLEEGRTEDFVADESLMRMATSLFNSRVRARVVYVEDAETRDPLTIESLRPWEGAVGDFSTAVAAFRKDLEEQGIEIDSSAWLRELRHDD